MIRLQDVIDKIKKHPLNKKILVAASLLVLLVISSSATLAFLHKEPPAPLKNTFTAAEIPTITISETFENNVKENVKVNVGDPGYSVYVRAEVIVTWKNEAGEVLGAVPKEGTDYTITYGSDNGWFQKDDGFWYCKKAVTEDTPILIGKCEARVPAPESGYFLSVDILAQSIQAAGVTKENTPAVTEAWGVTVDGDGNLTAAN